MSRYEVCFRRVGNGVRFKALCCGVRVPVFVFHNECIRASLNRAKIVSKVIAARGCYIGVMVNGYDRRLIRPHDLRHTFASHYLMRGGSLKGLKEILGHKEIKMTMRYAHLSREFVKEEIQILNGLTTYVKIGMSQNGTNCPSKTKKGLAD